jgi:uncharacterized protein
LLGADNRGGKTLYQAIAELLRHESFSGANVLRGSMTTVLRAVIITDKILRLSQDLPGVIEVVEDSEQIERILPKLDQMVGGGLITLEKPKALTASEC